MAAWAMKQGDLVKRHARRFSPRIWALIFLVEAVVILLQALIRGGAFG